MKFCDSFGFNFRLLISYQVLIQCNNMLINYFSVKIFENSSCDLGDRESKSPRCHLVLNSNFEGWHYFVFNQVLLLTKKFVDYSRCTVDCHDLHRIIVILQK